MTQYIPGPDLSNHSYPKDF
uniref:Uncharacterized protein n=1 Tax=Rhizophora mucronata TaxID=61149 RepID=A0A2P2R4Z3_RHIMU